MSQPVAKEKSNDTYLLVHRQPHDCTGTPEAAGAWEGGFGELGDALAGKGNGVLSDCGVIGETGRVLPLGGYTIVSAADLEKPTPAGKWLPGRAGGKRGRGRSAYSRPRPPAPGPHLLMQAIATAQAPGMESRVSHLAAGVAADGRPYTC